MTCPRCKGEGRVATAMPEIPGARSYNRHATRFVLSMMFVIVGMLIVPALAGISPWEMLRQGILAGIVVLAISIAGAFAVQFAIRQLTTLRCDHCLGRRWIPGKIPE